MRNKLKFKSGFGNPRHAGRSPIWLAVIAAAPFSLTTSIARADSTWISASGGSYADPTKWSSGVPGTSGGSVDDAYFGPINASYVVTFTSSPTASLAGLFVQNGSSPTFQLNSAILNAGTVTVGGTINGTASGGSLTIENGSLTLNQNAVLNIGTGSGTGVFTQLAGSTVTASTLNVGAQSGSGTYTLSGGSLSAVSEYIAGPASKFTEGIASNAVQFLYVGGTSSGSGTYNLVDSGGLGGTEYIGYSSSGTFNQSAGLNTASLIVGSGIGGVGFYNLSGTARLTGTSEQLGVTGGTGSFSQTGGCNNATTFLLGYSASSSASYTMSGAASFYATNNGMYVGYNGNGSFTQNDGTVVAAFVTVAGNVGASGTYTLSGGLLSAQQGESIGNQSAGVFIQSGGTNNAVSISVGGGTSPASYQLSGGVLQTSQGSPTRPTEAIYGTFSQSGGTNSGGVLQVGAYPGGTYVLSGGVLTMPLGENIGPAPSLSTLPVQASFTQSGGTNITEPLELYGANGGVNTYTLTGGVLNATNQTIWNSYDTLFSQSGGTNLAKELAIGTSVNQYTATYNLSGTGVLTVSNTEYIGNGGVGVFNQSGGSHSAARLYLGGAGGIGTYNLSGGTLSMIFGGTENLNGTFTQTGGTNNGGISLQGKYILSGGVLNPPGITANNGTLTVTGGTFTSMGVLGLTNSSALHGSCTIQGPATVSSSTLAPGSSAVELFMAGLSMDKNSQYDWQLGMLADSAGGTPGVDFSQIQLSGGSLAIAAGGSMTLDFSPLAAVFAGPANSPSKVFWKSSHVWTVLQLSGTASNAASSNFTVINGGKYSVGDFASQINPDGKSIGLVYNEMNITATTANNTVLGKITLTGANNFSGSATAGEVTGGSFDLAGLNPSNPFPILMDTHGSTASISQWFSEIKGAQVGGMLGYTISQVGPGFGSVPSWANVPTGDEGFLFTFTNVAGSDDRFLNFDWAAGNSGVTLDQVFVAPEPSVMGFIGFGLAAMLKRRRRNATRSR